jgi:hypothetical protein
MTSVFFESLGHQNRMLHVAPQDGTFQYRRNGKWTAPVGSKRPRSKGDLSLSMNRHDAFKLQRVR